MDWTDIKQAEPEESGLYLITVEGIDQPNHVEYCVYNAKKHEFGWQTGMGWLKCDDVIAWINPDPYIRSEVAGEE